MCRRCLECEHYEHHWMPNGAFGDDGKENNQCDHCCKHCNAYGNECGECHGSGFNPFPEYNIPSPSVLAQEACPECGGEGVVYEFGGDVVYSRQVKR